MLDFFHVVELCGRALVEAYVDYLKILFVLVAKLDQLWAEASAGGTPVGRKVEANDLARQDVA